MAVPTRKGGRSPRSAWWLCRKVLGVYVRALQGLYVQRAKRSGHPQCRTGCVTVIQRFGGALNLNIHFHTLVIDGVFCQQPDGSLSVVQASAPTDTEVERLVVTIQRRVVRLLTRRACSPTT